jgi:hypothetical protein
VVLFDARFLWRAAIRDFLLALSRAVTQCLQALLDVARDFLRSLDDVPVRRLTP